MAAVRICDRCEKIVKEHEMSLIEVGGGGPRCAGERTELCQYCYNKLMSYLKNEVDIFLPETTE